MMIDRIFLDLDGVIRDWIGGINKLFNTSIADEEVVCWDYVTRRICTEQDITEKEFWERQGWDFWVNLEFTKEAYDILDMLKGIKDVSTFILTSPTLNNAGASQEWIKRNMPDFFQKKMYLIGPAKYACAAPSALLIDDAEKNIDPWRSCGGLGFLYPRPWNKNRALSDIAPHELQRCLSYIC